MEYHVLLRTFTYLRILRIITYATYFYVLLIACSYYFLPDAIVSRVSHFNICSLDYRLQILLNREKKNITK